MLSVAKILLSNGIIELLTGIIGFVYPSLLFPGLSDSGPGMTAALAWYGAICSIGVTCLSSYLFNDYPNELDKSSVLTGLAAYHFLIGTVILHCFSKGLPVIGPSLASNAANTIAACCLHFIMAFLICHVMFLGAKKLPGNSKQK
jgi:cytosine/uracil/thiamine/allantoin permease